MLSTRPTASVLSRRAFLAGLGVALIGCKGKGSPGTTSTPLGDPTEPKPPAVRAPSPIGYSHVLRLDGPRAEEIAAAGLRFVQVEPFNTDVVFKSLTDLRRIRDAADVMRRAEGTLLLTVLNVHDPVASTLSATDFDDRVRRVVAEVGVSNVWLEAVSNGSANFRGFQDRARQIWPGSIVFALHPCSLSDARNLLSPARVVVSDCTPILASNVGEQDIKDLTRLAVTRRAIWLWYDTFDRVPWNSQVVTWMGEALR